MIKKKKNWFMTKVCSFLKIDTKGQLEKIIILELKQDKEYFKERMETAEQEVKDSDLKLEKNKQNNEIKIVELKEKIKNIISELQIKKKELLELKNQIELEKNKQQTILFEKEQELVQKIKQDERNKALESLSRKERDYFDYYEENNEITKDEFCKAKEIKRDYLKQIIRRIKNKGLVMGFEE